MLLSEERRARRKRKKKKRKAEAEESPRTNDLCARASFRVAQIHNGGLTANGSRGIEKSTFLSSFRDPSF